MYFYLVRRKNLFLVKHFLLFRGPPAKYGRPVDAVNSTLDTPIGNHMPNGTEGDSLLDGIG